MNEQFTVRVGFLKRLEDLLNGTFFTPKNQYIQMDSLELGLGEEEFETENTATGSSHTAITKGLTPPAKTASAESSAEVSSQASTTSLGEAVLHAFGVFGEPSNPTVTIPSNANDAQVNAMDSQVLGGQMSAEAIEATAKNPAFAQIAAFFLALSKWIAEAFEAIQKHVQESSATYHAATQVYARSGLKMG